MVRRVFIAAAAIVIASLTAGTVRAAAEDTGIAVTPLRSYLALDAGSTVTRSLSVANRSSEPLTITTHIEQFSMADYTYDYRFEPVKNNWVTIAQPTLTLQPFESRDIPYQVAVPASAPPGGQYYTLYASSVAQQGPARTTVQVASLLYLTVNGDQVQTAKTTGSYLPWLVIGPTIDYTLDLKNTGNTHYFVLITGRVDGPGYRDAPNGTSHLLMPGTPRRIAASMAAPFFPGVYQLTYTITPDQRPPQHATHYFLYLPIWSLLVLASLIGLAVVVWRRRRVIRS